MRKRRHKVEVELTDDELAALHAEAIAHGVTEDELLYERAVEAAPEEER